MEKSSRKDIKGMLATKFVLVSSLYLNKSSYFVIILSNAYITESDVGKF